MKIQYVLGILAAIQLSYSTSAFADNQATHDHSKMTKQSERIEAQFHQYLMNDSRFQASDCGRVKIEVADGRAILTGNVDSDKQVKAAEELAKKAGAVKVNNLMNSFEEIRRNGG